MEVVKYLVDLSHGYCPDVVRPSFWILEETWRSDMNLLRTTFSTIHLVNVVP